MEKLLSFTSMLIFNFGLLTLKSSAQTAYITNYGDGTVSAINLITNTVTATIPIGGYPTGVSVSPDGTKVYITNRSDKVIVINTATNTVSDSITVDFSNCGICISPDGTKIYVTADSSVIVINTATNTVSDTIGVGTTPQYLTVSPDGTKLYITNGYNEISVINTFTNTISSTISVGNYPTDISVSPDGTKVYVANFNDATISVINANTNTVSATIGVGIGPQCITVSLDGTKVYVTCYASALVYVINTNTYTVSDTIPVSDPWGISMSLDGTKVYVASYPGCSVNVINTAVNDVSDTIMVGISPIAIGNFISTYTQPCMAYYTTAYDSTLNTFTLNVDSTITAAATSYHWDFGDGTSSTYTSPSHTYTADSVYNICMKVYLAGGDSCIYCHAIGRDSLGNIIRTSGFTVTVHHTSSPTGLPNNNSIENAISIFPNPTKGIFQITNTALEASNIEIYNMLGEEVHQYIGTFSNLQIDLLNQPNGIYFLNIKTEQGTISKKLIINE